MKEQPKFVRDLHKLEILIFGDTNYPVLPQLDEKLEKLSRMLIWKYLHASGLRFKTDESIEPFEGL